MTQASTATVSTLSAYDGTLLSLRTWPAPEGRVRGTVLIVHGLGEHSARYERVATRLREWGFQAVGYDHRGHGLSLGPRGSLQKDDDLLTDLATVVDHVRERHPGPFVLFGHSMGGLTVARFVAGELRPVDAVMLSSPALDIGLSALQRGALKASYNLTPTLQLPNGLDVNGISRDPDVVVAYKTDPLVHDRITPRLVNFMLQGGEFVRARAPQWKHPTLLMWATADRLVRPAGSATFAALAPKDLVQAHPFEGYFHELVNEPLEAREKVFDTMRSWLGQHVPSAQG
ncbi:MAG: lysophospholipase [Caldimonas sp.]|uniref:alpha/beta hydrolase n=1 Tax=Caldimonas sp. TaxID=2838790 RepID=UPI00391DF42B